MKTLKQRADFLRLRGGERWVTPGFVLQAARRTEPCGRDATTPREGPCPSRGPDAGCVEDSAERWLEPRFGFTVTKRIGSAVVRNRIKRRFRELVRTVAPEHARSGYDYVLIARHGALKRPFSDLQQDLKVAFNRVHRQGRRAGSNRTSAFRAPARASRNRTS